MHGKFREIKLWRLAVDRILVSAPRITKCGLTFRIDLLLTYELTTFHEAASKPLAIGNGRSDAAWGI
jgi:hypothetical protein